MSKLRNWFARQEKYQILLYVVIGGFVAWKQIPLLLSNMEKEGEKLAPSTYQVINPKTPGETLALPSSGKNILVFWATWCGPCKVEMNRLKESVVAGKIGDRAIVAISAGESPETVKKFLAKDSYPFTFIHAPEIGRELDVHVTPTTVFLENGVVTRMSSGLSLIGIWRAEAFL